MPVTARRPPAVSQALERHERLGNAVDELASVVAAHYVEALQAHVEMRIAELVRS